MSSKDEYYYDLYGQLRRRSPPQTTYGAYNYTSPSMAQGMNPYPQLNIGDTHSQMPLPASAAYQSGYSTQPRTTHIDPSYMAQYDTYGTHQIPSTNDQGYGYTSSMGSNYTTQAHATQRASPGLPPAADPRRLPPLSVPVSSSRHQDASYYAHSQPDPALISPSEDVRSPQAAYPQHYAPYASLNGAMYTQPLLSSSRAQPAYPGVSTSSQYPSATSHSVGVERTNSRHVPTVGQYPYARIPPATSPTDYGPQSAEPSVKKKRKRADARQLEVLTAVFARTQFPSTEERIQLGEQLGMTPRTVQIWFQNRRQALRQGQPSGTRGKTASATVGSTGHTSSAQDAARGGATGSASVPSSSRAANVAATSAGSSSLASRQARSVTPAPYASRSPAGTVSTSGPSYGSNSRSPEHPQTYSTSRSPAPGTSGRSAGAHSTSTVRGPRY
ncbi:unnamed protein product [Peniophora sp. CBMAI 1063]|nr:unnamed protein product [Peniophora sp. CBMAI 1063]